MSSSDRRRFLVLSAAALLGGCGFTPAYGPSGGASKLQGRILIDEPTGSDGYLLVRELENRLGRAQAPQYGLSLALTTRRESMAITSDNRTTRYNLMGDLRYTLRDLGTGEELASGRVDSFTGYSTTGSTVATRAARSDARERLMTILADRVTANLMAYAARLPQ